MFLQLTEMDTDPEGYALGSVSVDLGATTAGATVTIPDTLHFGSPPHVTTMTTLGGPRELEADFFDPNGTLLGTASATVDVTGVPTDQTVDDQSPHRLSYNPQTNVATVTDVPPDSFVEVFFRAEGQSESEAEANVLGWNMFVTGGTVTIPLSGVPKDTPGYLEAELSTSVGNLDTNELPVNPTPPAGRLPEVPWSVGLPALFLGGLGLMRWRSRWAGRTPGRP